MKTNGYWVYEITTPNEMVYVGMSSLKYTYQRWQPSLYKKTALEPYINEFGWDGLKEEVVRDGLTKEEAFQLEDSLIRKYKDEGQCINKVCSGGLCCDGKWDEYNKQHRETHKEQRKQYYEEHKEELKEQMKQYRETHKEQMKQYYEEHKEQKREYMREYDRKYYARQKELKKRASLNYDTLW